MKQLIHSCRSLALANMTSVLQGSSSNPTKVWFLVLLHSNFNLSFSLYYIILMLKIIFSQTWLNIKKLSKYNLTDNLFEDLEWFISFSLYLIVIFDRYIFKNISVYSKSPMVCVRYLGRQSWWARMFTISCR